MNFKTLWVRYTLKVILGVLLVLGILAGAVHTFLYYRAGELFKNFVENTSDGVYTASTKKLRFGYFPFRIKATEADFFPLDTTGVRRKYFIHADTIQMRLTSIIPILFHNSLEVKEVRLVKPMVKMENDLKRVPKGEVKFNIPLKEIQEGLLSSLALLKVDKCDILDGGFSFLRTDVNERLAINHINLTIDSLIAARNGVLKPNGDTVNANLVLSIDKPDIILPDSNYLVDLDRLFVDTKKNEFNIEELSFSRKKQKGTYDTLKLSSIALRGLNWDQFLNNGVIQLDSVRVQNGIARIDLTDRLIFQRRKDKPKEIKPVHIAVPLLLKNVSIARVTYELRSLRKTGPFTIRLDGDSLQLISFALKDSAKRPVEIGSLSMNVRNYYDQDDKKTYLAGFDRLMIRNDDLSIGNYRLIPLKKAGFSSNNRIQIPSLTLYNYDLTSLMQGRLQADRLELIRPELVVDILQKRDGPVTGAGDGLFRALNGLQRTLDIGELRIRDAVIILQPRNDLANTITISQLSTDLNVEKLLDASSVNDLMQVAEDIHSDGFFISGPRFDLKVDNALIAKGTEQVNIGRLRGNISNVLEVDLDSVMIRAKPGELLIPVNGMLNLETVNIGSGVVMVIKEETADSIKRIGKPAPGVNISNLQTGLLQVTYFKNNGSLFAVQEMALHMQGLETGKDKLNWLNLFLKGRTLVTTSGKNNIRVGEWEGNLPGSLSMKNVKTWPANGSETGIHLDLPLMEAKNSIHGMKWDPASITELQLFNPQLRWNLVTAPDAGEQISEPAKAPFPVFIKKVTIIDPEISGDRHTKNGGLRHSSLERGNIVLNDVDLFYRRPDFITLSGISANLFQPIIEVDSNWTVKPSQVRLLASDFEWKKQEKPTGLVDSLVVEGIGVVPVLTKTNQMVSVARAGIAGWNFSTPGDSIGNLLLNGPDWWAGGINYSLKDTHSNLNIYNAAVTRKNRRVSFDSLTWYPLLGKDSFWARFPVQKDYFSVKMGKTEVFNFRPPVNQLRDSTVLVQSIHAKNLELVAARDKRYPEDTVTYRPLLTAQLGQLPFHLKLDSLVLENGNILYSEIGNKFKKEGHITLDSLNGYFSNIHSRPAGINDTLLIDVKGKFMKAAPLYLFFSQPYTDSLQSFRFNVRMGRWSMQAINPLLAPINSIAFQRGNADSMWLNAYGNQYRAFGWMGFKYHKMSMGILKNGGESKYFMSGLVNAGTNLVLVNNNDGHATPFYVERLKNKSTFNFWGKILSAGLRGSLGMPGKQKSARKAMRKEKLPAQAPGP